MSEILDLIRRRLVFIIACGLIAAGVPAALSMASPDSYRATARLFVATAAQDVTAANQGNLAAQSRVRSYALLAVGPELLARAAQRSGVPITEGTLASRISVSTPPDTVLLDIAATAGTPQEAAALSDAVSLELVTLVSQAERPLRGGSPSLGLLILQPADAGVAKVPVIVPTRLALFGAAGLVVGAVIAILIPGRFRLRRRRRGGTTDTAASEAAPLTDAKTAHDVSPAVASTGVAPESVPPERVAPSTASAPRDDRDHADHHPNWATFDTIDTATHNGVPRPAVNRRRFGDTPPQRSPSVPPPHPGDRGGWEDRTDPSGRIRAIDERGEPLPGRRHRRESGGWHFSPDNGGGNLERRPTGLREEAP